MPRFSVSLRLARKSSCTYVEISGRFSVYVPASNRLRFFVLTRPSMKLATSNPVALLTEQPAPWPAQFDVMLLLNAKFPTIVSAFRISRDRNVRLPPALRVCLPLVDVTLSKIWKSFWLVMSGWLLFAPRFRMFWKLSWVIADATELTLMPGRPTAFAGLVP